MDDLFVTPLGTMSIVEMLLFYEGPKLFTCRDQISSLFMVHLVEENDEGERWFFVPMSPGRLEEVRTGGLGLRESVLWAETGHIFDVFASFDDPTIGYVTSRAVSGLDESELPGPNACLKRPADRLPTLTDSAAAEATQAMRDVLHLALDNGRHDQIIAADDLGSILLRTQNLVRQLGDRRDATRGRIPKDVSERHTLLFTGTYAASVGIRLQSKGHTDLIDTPTREALELFVDLLAAGDNRDELVRLLKTIPKRAISRYRFLLDALNSADLNLNAKWGSPGRPQRTATLTKIQACAVLDLLVEEGEDLTDLITLTGDLTGVVKSKSGRSARFEFVSSDGVHYRGAISPDLVNYNFRVTTPGAQVTLEATTEINDATGEETTTYVLISMNGATASTANAEGGPPPSGQQAEP